MSNPTDLTLIAIGRLSEDEARAYFEALRWPDDIATCPKCGVVGEASRMERKPNAKMRRGVWNCRACRQQFTVTVGGIMEGSHLPLVTWLAAFYILGTAKKSVSALQLQTQLGIGSYRTAWHLLHRVRATMANEPTEPPKLTGVIEADEGYFKGKPRYRKPHKGKSRTKYGVEHGAAVLIARDGEARMIARRRITSATIQRFVAANVDTDNATLRTDDSRLYNVVGEKFAGGHESVCHSRKEYARPGGVHSNTAECFIGLFKRAIDGSWHSISPFHAQRYADEHCFRWNRRKMSGSDRTLAILKRIQGVRLFYRQPKGQASDKRERLVARRQGF